MGYLNLIFRFVGVRVKSLAVIKGGICHFIRLNPSHEVCNEQSKYKQDCHGLSISVYVWIKYMKNKLLHISGNDCVIEKLGFHIYGNDRENEKHVSHISGNDRENEKHVSHISGNERENFMF